MCLKKIVIPAVQRDPLHNLKMLTEKPNDEKVATTLLIVGSSLIACHFWQKINGVSIIYSRWCCGKCISL